MGCDEVTEIQCEIVPYTECQMTMDPTPYKSFDMVTKTFNKRVCKEGMDVVQHTKMMPECRNGTLMKMEIRFGRVMKLVNQSHGENANWFPDKLTSKYPKSIVKKAKKFPTLIWKKLKKLK